MKATTTGCIAVGLAASFLCASPAQPRVLPSEATQPSTSGISVEFNDSNTNAWTVVDNSGLASDWRVAGGEYRQSNFVGNFGAALQQGYHLGTYSFLLTRSDMSDYRFSIDLTSRAKTGEEIGVLFYYQDADNYYRFSTSLADGFSRLERKLAGRFTTLAQNARGYPIGTQLATVVDIKNGVMQIAVNGEKLFSAYDTALTSGTVGLYCRDAAAFDNVRIAQAPTASTIAIAHPTNFSVSTTSALSATATVLNKPAAGSVRFKLDGSLAGCTPAIESSPGLFSATCTAATAGVHALTAELLDRSRVIDSVSHDSVATGGNVYVTIGDSNTWGEGDLYSADGISKGGWRQALQGYQSNLVDDLNATTQVVNIAFNESVRGDAMRTELADRLPSYLERNRGANRAIVSLGINDARGVIPFSSGYACSDAAACYTKYKAHLKELVAALKELLGETKIEVERPLPSGKDCSGSACDRTFKGYLKAIVAALNAAGMTPIIVQVPPRFGDAIGSAPYRDPAKHPVNATFITEYNQVIRGADADPLMGYIVGPDLLRYYLTGGANRFDLFYDNLHLSGLAQTVLAAQLRNLIAGGSQLPFVIDAICVTYTTAGSCTEPTPFKQDLLEVGDRPYIDREYVLTGTLPSQLNEGRWIRTAAADLSRSNGNYLAFTIDKASTVYVAFDAGASVPAWLSAASGFTDTGLQVLTNDPHAPALRLFAKGFSAGSVTLGGADAATTRTKANYLVVVK